MKPRAVRGGPSGTGSSLRPEGAFIGSAGPWVAPGLRRVERFKFYQQVAWSRPRLWRLPFQAVARWRCRHDRYGLPVEKLLSDWLWPQPALS